MTTQELDFENNNRNLVAIISNFKFNDYMFEGLLSVINDETEFINKLFEYVGFDICPGFNGLMYSALLEAFIAETEIDTNIVEIPKQLMAFRFADKIKEAINKYTPEYYNFVNTINYYDYRLLPIITDDINNPRDIIETVLRDKSTKIVSDFINNVFPEVEHIVDELNDEILKIIMPLIVEYNKTTTADKEVVMHMIINPEALFTLKTENSELSNVIVQTILEQVDKKRKKSEWLKPSDT